MTEPDTLAPAERELAATLRVTLERKAAEPDPLLEAALAATRARIATPSHRQLRHPWWLAGGFAVAASVAMVMVMLPQGSSTSPAPGVSQTVAESVAMPDADLQFLQDMDMLVAMNENGS